MNPHFGNTFTHRLVVTEISFLRTVNTRLDPTGDLFVSQGVKPSVKNFGRVDRLHGALYQLGYTNVNLTKSFAKLLGLKPVTTPVTSPQSNGMAESFVKTLKRDYAKLANRPDSKTVMAQLQGWFDDYNSYHPHSALGYLPPTVFREKRSVT